MKSRLRRHRAWLLVLLWLAFGLRLWRLAGQSLWWDEGISLHLATGSLADLLLDRAGNLHPPGYFILLKGWVSVAGATPFAARYLSLLAGWLQVPLLWRVSGRWLGRRPAGLAAGLVAFSPLAVIYAQETRVYAFLPLIYLGLLYITKLVRDRPAADGRLWWALGGLSWLGLHLHYISGVIVAYCAIWLVLGLRPSLRRRWFLLYATVSAATLPWALAVLSQWRLAGLIFNSGRALSEPIPAGFLLAQVWGFHWTGLAGSLGQPVVARLVLGLAAALGLLLAIRLSAPAGRRGLWLLLQWLLPVAAAFAIWSLRSFSHPRYIILFAVGLWPLLAWLLTPATAGWRRRATLTAAGPTLALTAVLFGFSLVLYFNGAAGAKDDIRGAAAYLTDTAAAADLILVPDTDWSLPFEYTGPAPVAMPGAADWDRTDFWPELAALVNGRSHVHRLDYDDGTYDYQAVVPFALEAAGHLVGVHNLDGIYVASYQIDGPIAAPSLTPQPAQSEGIRLIAAWVEPTAAADSAVAVALQWQREGDSIAPLHVTLELMAADGWPVAVADDLLLSPAGAPTRDWAPAAVVTTYHLIPLPPGTAPVRYDAQIGLYEAATGAVRPLTWTDTAGNPAGQRQLLTPVDVTPPIVAGADPYGVGHAVPIRPQPVDLASGLTLMGGSLDRAVLAPGQSLFVQLLWQGTGALPDLRPALQLVQAGRVLVVADQAPALGAYPTSVWPPGALVAEHRRLQAPPGAAGEAQVVLRLGAVMVPLGTVTISGRAPQLTPPAPGQPLSVAFGEVARLVGYDIEPGPFLAGAPVALTLYWQSLATGSESDWRIFTHLLDESGGLVGQHDGAPAGGERPVMGWVIDEYLVDSHLLTWQDPAFTGSVRLAVGLYDPLTGIRLLADTGEDAFVLPTMLTVE